MAPLHTVSGENMKVSAYKKLLIENPMYAMIFDLTERFPRGPKGKLRRKDYTTSVYGEPMSDALLDGDGNGYDMFTLYKLCKKTWYCDALNEMVTANEDCAMGDKQGSYNYETREYDYSGKFHMFKRGAQTTRRIRRLESRLRNVRAQVEKQSKKNLYQIQAGGLRTPISVFGDSEQHTLQQFDLLLRSAFEAAIPSGFVSTGYDNEMRVHTSFMGPSHGPHEIVAANERFTESITARIAECKKKIKQMQDQIVAAEDLSAMVTMYTMNTAAQEFGDES